jgi:hypothetical protein
MEAPVSGTALHSFDRHRQSLQEENQCDPGVVQKIWMHPAFSCAGTGKEKSERYRAKQSDNESVLQASFFLSAFFHSILSSRDHRSGSTTPD